MQQLDSKQNDFKQALAKLLSFQEASNASITATVEGILAEIKAHGDKALLDYTHRFDRINAESMAELDISRQQLEQALESLPQDQLTALTASAERIKNYHERQLQTSWEYNEADGTTLGQQVTPLDRVGIYVPGGKAAYPSSVLMNAIPAKVAGVAEIIMVVPTPQGAVNSLVLAAAALSGVDRVFTIGGAQAIAALAYGTESVPKVDKIVGPGNIYVATAKKIVFGMVGIDMIAGPSEICIVCDGQTSPDWIAMDLFSQAEHDEIAQSILISPDAEYMHEVQQSIQRLLPEMERRDIIEASLKGRGGMIKVADLAEAADVVNMIAPEHLELSVAEPRELLPSIRHAGAIFMGRYTAEALGDYSAGPNHVLPTSGTARFSSPLGTYDFQKRSSLLEFSAAGADSVGRYASVLARGEGLTAHARSAEYRIVDYENEQTSK